MTEMLDTRSFEGSGAERGADPAAPLGDGSALLLFRAAGELVALDLRASEEALELPEINPVPEMRGALLGVFPLRDQLVPVYAVEQVLGVPRNDSHSVVIVVRAAGRRIGLAADDVEDVIMMDLAQLRPPPIASTDRLVLGVLHHGPELVSVIDVATLVGACGGPLAPVPEGA